MENSSDEESNEEGRENQLLLVIEETRKFDFRALIALSESDDNEDVCQAKDTIMAQMARIDSEDNEENTCQSKENIMALMARTDSEEDDDND